MIIGNEYTKKFGTQLDDEFTNAGVNPRGDQVPYLEEYVEDDQDPINPPPLTDVNIRPALFQISQDINTKAQPAVLKQSHDRPN